MVVKPSCWWVSGSTAPGQVVASGMPFGQEGGHPLGEEVVEGGPLLEHRAPHAAAVLEEGQRLMGESGLPLIGRAREP